MEPKLTYSSRGLNDDCTQVASGVTIAERPIETADLLQNLQNFSAIPSIEFVGTDANISLKTKGQEIVVTNESGQLFMVQAPVAANSAVARSAEEIVQLMDDEFSSNQAVEEEEVVITTGKARDKFGSPKLLVALVAVWAVIAYFTLAPEGVDGVTMVDDSGREANFAQQMEGKYGDTGPNGTAVFLVKDGRVKVFLNDGEAIENEPVLDQPYRFGHRDGELVLVVGNGAVLSSDELGSLVFEDEVYPRIP